MNIETIPVGPYEVNCYVLWQAGPEALVVDPGAEADRIESVLSRNGLKVAAYLLTHGHADHLCALATLHRIRPAPFAMHPEDAEWAFLPRNQIPPHYPAPERPQGIFRELSHSQACTDAGLEYRVLATPGHTPGGVCFYFPAERVLISGDTLFAGSVGRTDRPGGAARVLQRSLRTLTMLPDDTRVYPGHGPETTIGAEKKYNIFMRSAGR